MPRLKYLPITKDNLAVTAISVPRSLSAVTPRYSIRPEHQVLPHGVARGDKLRQSEIIAGYIMSIFCQRSGHQFLISSTLIHIQESCASAEDTRADAHKAKYRPRPTITATETRPRRQRSPSSYIYYGALQCGERIYIPHPAEPCQVKI
jgi:hypothetical protein